MPNLFRHYLFT